jgi:peptidyl-prolyl cis-trans isomerase D
MDRFRDSVGVDAAAEETMQRAVMNSVVQDMSRSAAVNAAAQDLGITVPSEQIRDAIMATPAFQKNGKFDQILFDQILSQNDLTENEYVRLFESDLRRGALLESVAANAAAPRSLVNSLMQYRAETRTADTLLLPATAVNLSAPPTDDELKAVYDNNIAAFTAPEYRKLSAVVLTSGDLIKPDAIDDAELKTYYDQNTARFKTPAKRHIVQIVFDTKEKAEAARALAAPDDSLETVATKAKAGAVIDLGEMTHESPLVKTIGPAFDLAPHTISQPVETPLGWHLFEVKSVTAESVTPFEEAKDTIRKNIAEDKGVDAVYDASVQLEDLVASGTPLPDIAKTLGARLVEVESTDRDGTDPRGLAVNNLPDPKAFLGVAFATAEGKESRLMDLAARNGYYIVRVEKVIPPTPKPLLDVRSAVAAMWEKQAHAQQAQVIAAKVAAEIGPSTQMSSVEAKDKRFSYAPLGPVTRFGEGLQSGTVVDAARISPELMEKLFAAKIGDTVTAPVADGVVVARLREISLPKPGADLAEEAQLTQAVRNAIGSDLINQITQAYATRYPVEVNQQVIDQMVLKR